MSQKINWFPGHMFKAKKELIKQLKIIDLVIEVVDARLPFSSHNEMLEELTKNKDKLIIFNKADLVNTNKLKEFIEYYNQAGYETIAIDSKNAIDRKKLINKIKQITKKTLVKYQQKDIYKMPRVLIMGMPNVGKSSVINLLTNKRKTEVGNKPGVTKQQQWINVENVCELLDTPGILIPNIENQTRAYKMVACNLIKDEVVELEHPASWLISYLMQKQLQLLTSRYNIEITEEDALVDVYDKIAIQIGAIVNKEPDYDRVAKRVISDFRKQKLGLLILDEIS